MDYSRLNTIFKRLEEDAEVGFSTERREFYAYSTVLFGNVSVTAHYYDGGAEIIECFNTRTGKDLPNLFKWLDENIPWGWLNDCDIRNDILEDIYNT